MLHMCVCVCIKNKTSSKECNAVETSGKNQSQSQSKKKGLTAGGANSPREGEGGARGLQGRPAATEN